MNQENVKKILEHLNAIGDFRDGEVTVPAYLFESLWNEVFPDDQVHDYTDKPVPWGTWPVGGGGGEPGQTS